MRKQTAPQTRRNREASSRKQSGRIAQDGSAQQSATPNCVLDDRSHRTVNWSDLSILLAAIRHRYMRLVEPQSYPPLGDHHDPLRCVQGVVRL